MNPRALVFVRALFVISLSVAGVAGLMAAEPTSDKKPKAWIEVGGKNPGTVHWENYAGQEWHIVAGRKKGHEVTTSVGWGVLSQFRDGIVTIQRDSRDKKDSGQYKTIPFAQLSSVGKATVTAELRAARTSGEKRNMEGQGKLESKAKNGTEKK